MSENADTDSIAKNLESVFSALSAFSRRISNNAPLTERVSVKFWHLSKTHDLFLDGYGVINRFQNSTQQAELTKALIPGLTKAALMVIEDIQKSGLLAEFDKLALTNSELADIDLRARCITARENILNFQAPKEDEIIRPRAWQDR